MSDVGIVLLNWNGWIDTIEALDSIFDCCCERKKIVIVDNFSTDNSVEHIKDYLNGTKMLCGDKSYFLNNNVKFKEAFASIKNPGIPSFDFDDTTEGYDVFIIRSPINGGYSKGNNLGINFIAKHLSCEYIWLLNNDTIIDKDSLGYLIKDSKDLYDRSFIGSTIVYYYDRERIQYTCGAKYSKFTGQTTLCNNGALLNELDSLTAEFDYISGCALFGHINLFFKVDNLSEDYFLYFEEPDLAKKAAAKKIGLAWSRESIVYHKCGASMGIRGCGSNLSLYHINLSFLIFTKKFHSNIFLIAALFNYFINFSRFISKNQFNKIHVLNDAYIDCFKNRTNTSYSNVKDGIIELLAETKKSGKLAVFGTGTRATRFVNFFYINPDYYVDNNPSKNGSEFNGKPVYLPEQLKNDKGNLTILIASMAHSEIAAQLENMGFINRKDFFEIEDFIFGSN